MATTTVAQLAIDYDLQPHEVAASLDLGAVADDHEVDAALASEVLDPMAGQAAERDQAPIDEAVLFHAELLQSEEQTDRLRAARDEAVREAIAGTEEHEPVTMYAIAKRLDIPEQSVRRIRDRA